jgi:hypothetical protein
MLVFMDEVWGYILMLRFKDVLWIKCKDIVIGEDYGCGVKTIIMAMYSG